MNDKPRVGIVIVNYNGEKYQNECIKTIIEMNYSNLEIVVVDSNSQDQSISKLVEEYGSYVTVLKQDYNCGVAKGNNIGIEYCLNNNHEYILLMNNDIEVDKNLLNELLEYADEKTVVVPKIYYFEPNNLIWFAGGTMNWKKGNAFHVGYRVLDNGQYDQVCNIEYSPTCCMLIHRTIIEKIGLFDDKIFMYFDDTDYCVRLIRNNFSIKYVPSAKLWHKVSSSTGGESSKVQVYYVTRNQLYFLDKYKGNISFSTRLYVHFRFFVKFILHPVRNANDRYIYIAWKDYKKGKMGVKNFN